MHRAQLIYVCVIAVLLASSLAAFMPPALGMSDGNPDF